MNVTMNAPTKRPVPELTRERQKRASDPTSSVWVAANAGSGKTHVLAQRVVRLLLDGVAPSRILCLTYTKAAAANMASRVFDMLADWSGMEDRALRIAIEAIGEDVPDARKLGFARRLFARTVETPGGLKVQTIHAFCERLLHLFPFEANVAAGFRVVEDAEQAELLSLARQRALADAALDADGLGAAVRRVASETWVGGFESLVKELLARRSELAVWLPVETTGLADALREALSLSTHETEAEIVRAMVEDGIAPSEWQAIGKALRGVGKSTDRTKAEDLDNAARAYEAGDLSLCLASYACVFFTDEGTGPPFTNLVTKDVFRAHPSVADRLAAERDRLIALFEKRKAAATFERTYALLKIGDAVMAGYARMKRDRGLLDFEDLIARTVALLKRSDQRWILFKLDAGLDHVLLDEAQDTSEPQWTILAQLTEDFFAGAGQRAARRTFFAVGDEKQSIFSFQGAAPKKFLEMHRTFRARVIAGGENFAEVPLNLSFRSSPHVLEAVDAVFAIEMHHRGLLADPSEKPPPHDAWKANLPGLVEIWNLEGKGVEEEPRDWRLPLDRLDSGDPPVKLAQRIAGRIQAMLDPRSGDCVESEQPGATRPVQAGDILILVRRRDAFFEAMIRALKERNIPTAGADRLALGEHIAVMDLAAAGQAALLPQDDLTLANVLKSPLIGLDDDDLLALAPGRAGAVIDALMTSPRATHAEAARRLALWQERARTWTPFDFFMQILGPEGGRHDLTARLGPEANDAIDEFLRLALAHEREEAPALATFLARFQDLDLEIKRDMDAAGNTVRVMTVHAAKGLEAKIIFLPDTCSLPAPQNAPCLYPLTWPEGPLLVWSPKKGGDPAPVTRAREMQKQEMEAEYRRLLYVAMTRAEERLIIAGYHGAREPAGDCWYKMVRAALEPGAAVVEDPLVSGATILRRGVARTEAGHATADAKDASEGDMPGWLRSPAPPETAAAPSVRPSSALAGADAFEPAATRRGLGARAEGHLMHVLLQYLPDVPRAARPSVAERLLASKGRHLVASRRDELRRQALAVLDDPVAAALFLPGSQAEVTITATLSLPSGKSIEIAGRIDRVAVSQTEVVFCDFKRGAPSWAGAPSPANVLQCALYQAALAPLYPDRRIRPFLIWTDGPIITELAEAVLEEALAGL
ncbi:MAG: double-strand break repair helicase AddA [Beijerinckiaceae bacterium]